MTRFSVATVNGTCFVISSDNGGRTWVPYCSVGASENLKERENRALVVAAALNVAEENTQAEALRLQLELGEFDNPGGTA